MRLFTMALLLLAYPAMADGLESPLDQPDFRAAARAALSLMLQGAHAPAKEADSCCLSGDSCMIDEPCCSGLLKNDDGTCP
jgi:hypothetical protein